MAQKPQQNWTITDWLTTNLLQPIQLCFDSHICVSDWFIIGLLVLPLISNLNESPDPRLPSHVSVWPRQAKCFPVSIPAVFYFSTFEQQSHKACKYFTRWTIYWPCHTLTIFWACLKFSKDLAGYWHIPTCIITYAKLTQRTLTYLTNFSYVSIHSE